MADTRLVTGYVHGTPFRLVVVKRDGVLMEERTAIAWGAMRDAAAKDGVRLKPNRGWASMDEQRKIWVERQDPTIRATKGTAAHPGWSNHQSGVAVDIDGCGGLIRVPRGMTEMPQPEDPTPVYAWLHANAKRFGFVRTVPSELWHWELVVMPERRTLEPL